MKLHKWLHECVYRRLRCHTLTSVSRVWTAIFSTEKLKYFGDFTLLFCSGNARKMHKVWKRTCCALVLLIRAFVLSPPRCRRRRVFFAGNVYLWSNCLLVFGFYPPTFTINNLFFFFFHSSEVLEKSDTCKCASLNVSSVRLGHWVLITDRIYVHGQKFVLGRLRVNIRSITVDPRSLEFPRETKMVRVSGGSR